MNSSYWSKQWVDLVNPEIKIIKSSYKQRNTDATQLDESYFRFPAISKNPVPFPDENFLSILAKKNKETKTPIQSWNILEIWYFLVKIRFFPCQCNAASNMSFAISHKDHQSFTPNKYGSGNMKEAWLECNAVKFRIKRCLFTRIFFRRNHGVNAKHAWCSLTWTMNAQWTGTWSEELLANDIKLRRHFVWHDYSWFDNQRLRSG